MIDLKWGKGSIENYFSTDNDSLLQLKDVLDHAFRIEKSCFNTWLGKQISVSHVRTFQMKQIAPDTIFQICSTIQGTAYFSDYSYNYAN